LKRFTCFLAIVILMLVVSLSASAYTRDYLNDQIDWVISEIRRGNSGMHYIANEYANAADNMGGISKRKIETLRNYVRGIRPIPPKTDGWPE